MRGRKLRRGFTTGTCAAAAAKAATRMLFSREKAEEVKLILPTGEKASFRLCEVMVSRDEARCCVVKDAGDDPDVTNGARICARVEKSREGIELKGGDGVGVVTKKGLQVSVGMPAINPVPREMITKAVAQVLPQGAGARVTIYVPGGERLARRTMNEKLGILGGISILGTTGIVEPMSVEAMKASLLPQIDVALAMGYSEVVLTPGRMGEKRAVQRGIPREAVIITGNHVGFILGKCAEKGIKKALLLGHAGKLTKIAAGAADTHSRTRVSPTGVIASHLRAMGAGAALVKAVLNASSTGEALEILQKHGYTRVFNSIAREACLRAKRFAGEAVEVGAVIFSNKGDILGQHNLGGIGWGRYLS